METGREEGPLVAMETEEEEEGDGGMPRGGKGDATGTRGVAGGTGVAVGTGVARGTGASCGWPRARQTHGDPLLGPLPRGPPPQGTPPQGPPPPGAPSGDPPPGDPPPGDPPRASELPQRLLCGSCGGLLCQPKLLPCLHAVCQGCLHVTGEGEGGEEGQTDGAAVDPPSVSSAAVTGVVRCGVCGERSRVPPGGTSELPTDHLRATELLRHRVATAAAAAAGAAAAAAGAVAGAAAAVGVAGPTCDLCCVPGSTQQQEAVVGDDKAHSYCDECAAFLCEFCTEAHRRQRPTAAHRLTPLQPHGASSSSPSLSRLCRVVRCPVRCREHAVQEVRYRCARCSVPACRDCCVAGGLHGAHGCEAADVVARRVTGEARGALEGAQARVRAMEESMRELQELSELTEERAERTRDDIESFRRAYELAVHTHYHSLLHSLDEKLRLCRTSFSAAQRLCAAAWWHFARRRPSPSTSCGKATPSTSCSPHRSPRTDSPGSLTSRTPLTFHPTPAW
ncbi:E3 ubiquitin-protein ligase TRIM45-like [Lampetra fluviatilis]